MPTTIDSLQIEIQSSSTSASAGIRDLAKSLGELKGSGTVTTAIKNLGKLSDALRGFTDASNATRSIGKLAGALSSLKNIGSVSNVGNSLTKLGSSLQTIGAINIDDVGPKIAKIAAALKPLSEVKAGGINTMVNGLKKIGEVTEKLDDKTIDAFADRIKKLNDVLEPLSKKMTTIQTGLRGVNSKARSAGSSMKQMGGDVNVATLNFSTFANSVRVVVQALQKVIDLLQQAISAAIEWDGIKYQFGNTFGDQADFYYNKITEITDALKINKQTFMEVSAMAGSMLIGFGVSDADAREMGVGYTELAYDIWAAFNNVYKTMDGADGAVAAVRSAIAGEVEPIRRAGFTIVDSQLAITAANLGLEYSTSKATEAQKSYLRYLTLVEQAHGKGIVGAYAREMNTAEGMMRTFSQQLKSLTQSFGSLFIPILVKVMPYLQAFVDLLGEAVRGIAAFFGVKIQDIGDTWTDYSTSVSSAVTNTEGVADALDDATKAAKELKNATLGIDDLNVISPPSTSSSSSADTAGGGLGDYEGLDINSLWDQSIFDGIQNQVDDLKQKIKDFLPTVGGIAGAFAGWSIMHLLDDLDVADGKIGKLKGTVEKLGKVVAVAGISIAVGTIVWDFTGAYLDSGNMGDLAKILGTTVLGTAVAAWLAGPKGAGVVLATSGIVSLTRLAVELKEGSVSISDPAALTTALVGAFETILGGAVLIDALRGGKGMAAIGAAIKSGLETAALKGMYALDGVKAFLNPLTTKIGTALSGIGTALAGVSAWAWAAVAAIVGALALAIVDYDFTDIGYKVGSALAKVLGGAVKWFVNVGKAISEGLTKAFNWVKEEFEIDSVFDLINLIFNPVSWVTKIGPKMIEVGKEVLPGIWEGITRGWKNFWSNIGEFVRGFVKGWKDALGIKSPSKVFIEIGKQIIAGLMQPLTLDGIKQRLSEMWSNAKSWWDTTKAKLADYTPNIGSIKNKLSAAWTTAKTWWEKSKAKLADYTPNIGSIKNKVSSAWSTAKTWWEKSKAKLADYTPNIGSIKNKVSSAWTTARNWWNKSKSSFNTYTPTIGSITNSLKTAWDNAKKWWKNNVKGLSTKFDLKVPTLTIKWGEVKVLGQKISFPKGFDVKFAADGGIFDMGSLIWAGERGPEIVAGAGGGRTGVMNVQQMQDAVYEGVYSAVVAAMRATGGNGGSPAVKVYLDGRQVTNTVEQRQRERGAGIMGNQVYSYG